jgi:hydrogenase maturation protein HypF
VPTGPAPMCRRLRLTGTVQGVGMRPFVWRLATGLGLSGSVVNDASGVTIEVAGPGEALEAFETRLLTEQPPLCRIERIERIEGEPSAPFSGSAETDSGAPFRILESRQAGPRNAFVPSDIAPCANCLAELRDPANRRHGHAFISCSDCGPRFTIIEDLPYDRASTTMRGFPLCGTCAADYQDPGNRRHHTEAIACPACGPVAWFVESHGVLLESRVPQSAAHGTPEAIAAARHLLARGGILAIKGIGGFHLACDATDPAAVARLRDRKRRGDKPLAVMAADVATAARFAVVDGQGRRLLESPERPILLLPRISREPVAPVRPASTQRPSARRDSHRDSDFPAAAVAPGLGWIGVMLPPSPLHALVCEGLPPLVMTSGNLSEEPIVHDEREAARLAALADGFLMHDRPITTPCDDSVVRLVRGGVVPIRRSRGYAPLPIRLATGGPVVLAVGGELKAAVCVTRGAMAFLGPHVGDVENLETLEALDRGVAHLLRVLDVSPEAVAADLHPGYRSADWARRFAAARGIPFLPIQHHEAHAAALWAEHGHAEAAPAGSNTVCFDGTGYGRDGSIRGGEFLVARDGDFLRAACLASLPLPGGDACIRHPWRTALAALSAAGIAWDPRLPPVRETRPEARRLLARQLETGLAVTPATSLGRLFDAVAAIAGLRQSVTFEAEAALALEAAATGFAGRAASSEAPAAFPLQTHPGGLLEADWREPLAEAVRQVLAGSPPAAVAAGFHEAVAAMVVAVCRRLRADPVMRADGPVGLTGGVFQNAFLLDRVVTGMHAAGFDVFTHHAVPPNDGGLALGQAVIARRLLAR